ncbi:hypothetical protein CCH79_00018603 [Gambusia affinis]|uniref:Uncharacterized protein n=1 Tax=Gambusia affinis TaxID=33528 RepID=A0A315VJL2_GAMAF|nr:hypothetical protein CCH79_00018603 [Gambusia affinis]
MVKRELSQKAKLSIPTYIPTLIYGHELWVITERTSVPPGGCTAHVEAAVGGQEATKIYEEVVEGGWEATMAHIAAAVSCREATWTHKEAAVSP